MSWMGFQSFLAGFFTMVCLEGGAGDGGRGGGGTWGRGVSGAMHNGKEYMSDCYTHPTG